jgi:hypothetical protein
MRTFSAISEGLSMIKVGKMKREIWWHRHPRLCFSGSPFPRGWRVDSPLEFIPRNDTGRRMTMGLDTSLRWYDTFSTSLRLPRRCAPRNDKINGEFKVG